MERHNILAENANHELHLTTETSRSFKASISLPRKQISSKPVPRSSQPKKLIFNWSIVSKYAVQCGRLEKEICATCNERLARKANSTRGP